MLGRYLILPVCVIILYCCYRVFVEQPSRVVPRLGSRLQYPARLKMAGIVFTTAGLGLATLPLLGAVAGDAARAALLLAVLIGVPGVVIAIEAFSTRLYVTADGVEGWSWRGHLRVAWSDVSELMVTPRRHSVSLVVPNGRLVVSSRLLNLSVFGDAALRGVPRGVLNAAPSATSLIQSWRQDSSAINRSA